jgi:hypothetical protein
MRKRSPDAPETLPLKNLLPDCDRVQPLFVLSGHSSDSERHIAVSYSGDHPTGEIQASLRPADSEHYREMAHKLRAIARETRFTGARREILKLATSYDRRAARF